MKTNRWKSVVEIHYHHVILYSLFLIFSQQIDSAALAQDPIQFLDVTRTAGIDFNHIAAFTPEKYYVAIVGSGCAFLDYDRDGWLDIFLVNGGKLPGFKHDGEITHGFYRNLGNGRFQNVTRQTGIGKSPHFGMGVTVGDYDNNGFDDLYLTYFGGSNQLYRNNGDGTFTDVSQESGVAGDGRWSTSAAFFDYDNDGYLDLYVAHYLDLDLENNRICRVPYSGGAIRIFCSPKIYAGVPDVLFHNNGDGTFIDVSSRSGIASLAGKSLGVVAADLNRDGWMDLYVANDTTRNFLFKNNGDGTFEEMALLSGVALDENGKPQAGMGIGCADYDGDGLDDLAVSNLVGEYLAIYRNLGDLFFEDATSKSNVKLPSSKYVGFGVGFLDFDNDTDLDIFVANGHIDDVIHIHNPPQTFPQPKLLFENTGTGFAEISVNHGEALLKKQVSRGTAFGDYDNDGDVDILVANCGGRPMLLRNEGGNRRPWLNVGLKGTKSNGNGIGSVLTLKTDKRVQKIQVMGGGSYLSSSSPRVHIGLGEEERVSSLTIGWPSGMVDQLGPLDPNQFIQVQEGTSLSPPQR